jgi:hypothetical protein
MYEKTQNTIKAFKIRAQAIFSLLEKKHHPGLQSLSSSIFLLLYIMGTQGINIYIYISQKRDTTSCFAKLRAISNSFSFFIHPVHAYFDLCRSFFNI